MRHLPLNELSRFTGINENELLIILDEMTKDNKVKKEEGVYALVEDVEKQD